MNSKRSHSLCLIVCFFLMMMMMMIFRCIRPGLLEWERDLGGKSLFDSEEKMQLLLDTFSATRSPEIISGTIQCFRLKTISYNLLSLFLPPRLCYFLINNSPPPRN